MAYQFSRKGCFKCGNCECIHSCKVFLILRLNDTQWAILLRTAPRSNVSVTTAVNQDTSPRLVPHPEQSQPSNAIHAAV